MYKLMAVGAVCAASAFGQGAPNSKNAPAPNVTIQLAGPAEFGPIGITAAMAGPMATVAGAPYSAQAVTQHVQMLADGNRIEQSTSGSVARDAQGRVYRDEALPGFTSHSGEAPHLVHIEDPIAGVHWTLDAQNKMATKMPFAQAKGPGKIASFGLFTPPPPVGPEKTWFYVSPGAAPPGGNVSISTAVKMQPSADNNSVTKADLGMQNVEGVPARGTRFTRTLPAGAVGNEQPIVITTETWYSPDLKVLVMSKTNDPRIGETTYRLTGIQRADPPASLFQIPDDYTIKDQPTNTFLYHELKKSE
jgi:hypothetical protein